MARVRCAHVGIDVRHLRDWLIDGAPGARRPELIVERLGPALVEAGVPVHRVAAFVRTLHPHIAGRSFTWSYGGPVVIRELPYASLASPTFTGSPITHMAQTGEPLRRRIADPTAARDFPILEELAREGATDYLALPMRFLTGEVHAVTFATLAPGGFTDDHLAAIESLMPPLARVAEILALARTAANLLNTYVGHDAGERILAGKIRRGDTDAMQAVLWFSDLRGFTALSEQLTPADLIRVLNELFDCQVPVIERHGGEVLKFMGDGLLAIFPLAPDVAPTAVCDTALAAAHEALDELATLNARRAELGAAPIRFGLALHVGEVAYGNIGGSGRLDFTCIGPAVNLASRLEGLTGKLGRSPLLSAEVARLVSADVEHVGTYELKGVAHEVDVYAPRAR